VDSRVILQHPLRRRHSSAIPPLPPITPGASPIPAPSSQQRERAPRRDKWQKADVILQLITKDFRSLGAFLETLFHCRDLSINDPRTASHKRMVIGSPCVHQRDIAASQGIRFHQARA
ncbi:hypothetical protein K438DRAFT_2145090, partial [Mycena galopus ATCC 62051]